MVVGRGARKLESITQPDLSVELIASENILFVEKTRHNKLNERIIEEIKMGKVTLYVGWREEMMVCMKFHDDTPDWNMTDM